MRVYTALGIIHNCAKVDENKMLLRKCRFIEAAHPYTDTDNTAGELVINAVMAISYVMEENEASIARINQRKKQSCSNSHRRYTAVINN